jgi:hypothetical protein
MKIIGIAEDGYSKRFICEITACEIARVFGHYCERVDSCKIEMKIGTELDLGAGYNYRNDIRIACQTMCDASKQFHDSQATLLKFSEMIVNQPAPTTSSQPTQPGEEKENANR